MKILGRGLMSGKMTVLRALGDNFIYLWQYAGSSILAVDPSDAAAVLNVVTTRRLQLTHILATHHHWDHTAGIAELKKKTGCTVIGSDSQIPKLNNLVHDGDVVPIGDVTVQVITTPGHTRTSVCYYVPAARTERAIVWTGDTMFVGGCGRVLEYDMRTMWNSLSKLASLPPDTLLYCGHDYTEENYRFALTIEPDNQEVTRCLQELREKLKQGELAVPSTIEKEIQTNIFLHASNPRIKAALRMKDATDADVFAELRRRKDVF